MTPSDQSELRQQELDHVRNEVEYILNDDATGEVRVTYGDGHSEIKDAKVLLSDDIMRIVEGSVHRLIAAADQRATVRTVERLAAFFKQHHLYDQDAAMKLNVFIKQELAELEHSLRKEQE